MLLTSAHVLNKSSPCPMRVELINEPCQKVRWLENLAHEAEWAGDYILMRCYFHQAALSRVSVLAKPPLNNPCRAKLSRVRLPCFTRVHTL